MKNKTRNTIWTIFGVLLMVVLVYATTISDTGISSDGDIDLTDNNLIGVDTISGYDDTITFNKRNILISTTGSNPQLLLKRGDNPGVDGQGADIRFEHRDSEGTLYDAVQLNGGFVNTDSRNSTLDIKVYFNGTLKTIAFSGKHQSIQPADDNTWNLGTRGIRFKTGHFKNIAIEANESSMTCSGTEEGDIYYDGNTNKHYGCDGSSWNALY